MSGSQTTAVHSRPFFGSSDKRGSTLSGFGGKVSYGGTNETPGEVLHSGANSDSGLTVAVSSVMTFLDFFSVIALAMALIFSSYVVITFLVFFAVTRVGGDVGVESVAQALGLTHKFALFVYDLGCYTIGIVVRPFTAETVVTIVSARVVVVVFLAMRETLTSARGRSVGRLSFMLASGVVTVLYMSLYGFQRVTFFVYAYFFYVAENKLTVGPVCAYLLSLVTTVVRWQFVLCLYVVIAGTRAMKPSWYSLSSSFIERNVLARRFQVAGVGKRQKPKVVRDGLVMKLSQITGLYAPSLLGRFTSDDILAYSTTRVKQPVTTYVRMLALRGDREISCMIARVGNREGWDVKKCDSVALALTTNAALAKYFDTKLLRVFPELLYASDSTKGTVVEALVGAACMSDGYYASVERFVLNDIGRVVGFVV